MKDLLKNNLLYYCLLFLLVFIPLYPKFPLVGISGTFVSVRVEDFVIAGVGLIWLATNRLRLRELFGSLIFRAFLLFWFITGVSVISGVLVTHTVEPTLGFLHWARRIEYMSLFLVAATTFTTLNQVKRAIVVFLVAAFLVILYGFGQILLHFPVISTTNSEFAKGQILYLANNARVNSTFAGHYDLAVYLSMVLVLSASLFFFYKSLRAKGLIIFNSLIAFGLLGLTAARISFVATVVAIAGVFWLQGRRFLLVGLITLSVLTVMAVPDLRHRLVATLTVNILQGGGAKYNPPPGTVTVFTPQNQLTEADKERLAREATQSSGSSTSIASDTVPGEPVNSTELGVYRSWGIRLNVEWPRALSAFYKNPMLGTGYSSITIATDNDFLRSLGETGLLGTLSLFLIFVIIFKKMYWSIKTSRNFDKYLSIASFMFVAAVLITGSFIDVLEASKIAEVFWLLLGVCFASINRHSEDLI